MKLSLKYPIFTKASGVHSGKLVNISLYDEFDINNASSSDLPIAFEFKREKGRGSETLRYDEKSDSLYNKVCRVNKIEDQWHGWSINAGQHPSKYYAAILKERIKSTLDADSARTQILRGYPLIEETPYEINPSAIEFAKQEYQKVLSNFVVIDDFLYRKSEEPIFTLYKISHGWKSILSNKGGDDLSLRNIQYNFSLSQYDEMVDWKSDLASSTGSNATNDHFIDTGIYKSKRNGHCIDAQILCKITLSNFEHFISENISPTNMKTLNDWNRAEPNSIPTVLMEWYLEFRRFLDIAEDEMLDEHIDSFYHGLNVFDELVREKELKQLFVKPIMRAAYQEKWDSRPISINPQMSL